MEMSWACRAELAAAAILKDFKSKECFYIYSTANVLLYNRQICPMLIKKYLSLWPGFTLKTFDLTIKAFRVFIYHFIFILNLIFCQCLSPD